MAQLQQPTMQWGMSRDFGGSAAHNGQDYMFPMNTPVYAAADGTVAFEGWGQYHSWMLAAAGVCVLIAHSDLHTGYAHLNSTVVNKGQAVKKGQLIGYSGTSGNSTGPHLHFEVLPPSPNWKNGFSGRIDPKPYFTTSQGGQTVNQSDLDQIYSEGPLGRSRNPGEGEDVYLGKSAAFVIVDHKNSVEGKNRASALAAQAKKAADYDGLARELSVEKAKSADLQKKLDDALASGNGSGVDTETKKNIQWIKDKIDGIFK